MPKVHLYEPQRHVKLGVRIWAEMAGELVRSRELIWRLFMRDLNAKYRQAAFGYIWIVLMPFIGIATFVYLHKMGIVHIGDTGMPYPLYAIIGFSVWQLFTAGLTAGTNSLISAGDMIAKINFSREVLIISSLGQAVFEFSIKGLLIAVCFFIFGFIPSWWGVLLFPFSLLPLLALTIGLSLGLSILNAVFRDTANMISLALTFLMFITPVFYPIANQNAWGQLNILSALISAPRDLIAYGTIKDPAAYTVASVCSLLVLAMAWRIFHLVETKIAERL